MDMRESWFRKTCMPARFNPLHATLIDDNILIGSREAAANMTLLRYYGVTHVRRATCDVFLVHLSSNYFIYLKILFCTPFGRNLAPIVPLVSCLCCFSFRRPHVDTPVCCLCCRGAKLVKHRFTCLSPLRPSVSTHHTLLWPDPERIRSSPELL